MSKKRKTSAQDTKMAGRCNAKLENPRKDESRPELEWSHTKPQRRVVKYKEIQNQMVKLQLHDEKSSE